MDDNHRDRCLDLVEALKEINAYYKDADKLAIGPDRPLIQDYILEHGGPDPTYYDLWTVGNVIFFGYDRAWQFARATDQDQCDGPWIQAGPATKCYYIDEITGHSHVPPEED